MVDPLARYRPYLAMTALFAVVLLGTILVLRRPEPVPITITTATPRPTPTLAAIVVDVRGAVANPGVYTFPSGSRVQDALVRAGNPIDGAETRGLNLARKLNDGEQIYVPTLSEATPTVETAARTTGRGPTATRTPLSTININTATVEELDALPGIGPSIAQRIVEYRTQNGEFQKPEDLKNVRGIGDGIFDQIKSHIAVK